MPEYRYLIQWTLTATININLYAHCSLVPHTVVSVQLSPRMHFEEAGGWLNKCFVDDGKPCLNAIIGTIGGNS